VKAVITLCLALLICAGSVAQKTKDHAKTERHQMDRILDGGPALPVYRKQITEVKAEKIARLYRFRKARIRAELSFRTKKQNLTV
jgi:IS4 transposase